MDKFIVSARKYRPQAFDTVVGQAHITTTLKNAIKNQQLAHAFLFCGPRGVGKTTCARILAKTINCENASPEGEACNTCHSCVSFNEGTSLNIHELDAASNNSVDDIRSLVEQVRFPPQAGKYKVYIIDEVHMLSSSAFNAFLKTLEEPPSYAIFILATTEKHKILPTILSRCQIFDFKRITTNDTVEHLEEICSKEHISAEKAGLQVIAQKSEGCMRDALSIMDKIVSFTNGQLTYHNTLEHLNILDADYYFKLIDSMEQQDLASALLLYDDINRKGFEGDMVMNGFAEFIRNLLVCKDEKVASLLEVVESFRERYLSTGKKISIAWLISALNVLNEAEINYKSARNKRLHVELAIIRLSYLQQAITLTGDGQGVTKKKLIDTVKPVALRRIPPFEIKQESTVPPAARSQENGTKLIIEEAPVQRANARTVNPETKVADPSAGSAATAGTIAAKTETPKKALGKSKLGSLENIRQQFANAQVDPDANKIIAVTDELLKQHWIGYTDKLKAKKNPAVQSFELATLTVTAENAFEVLTNNNLEQRFIEQERRFLSEFLQEQFNNRSLTYSIIVSDTPVHHIPIERPMNKREQFMQIVEQYPLIKELKDRLKLELDY
ncbi:MAG: DNA polymerase III subunit gamma/tau [Chitinophagaceae bacterium]|nr:MAG: DNA polymerase III subunit gamma/tau [Chitinophagaceae bacterium]